MSGDEAAPRRIARGQRVIDEVEIVVAHDGKEKAASAKRHEGPLPPDLSPGRAAPPVTTEDVVHVDGTPSVWEARESDGRPDRPGATGPNATGPKWPRFAARRHDLE